MKRALILMIAVAVVAAGATLQAKEKKEVKGKAEAFFSEVNYDFGYIEEAKGAVKHDFEFENVGDEPLIIISATASCGCTRPEYPTKPIKPGKKAKVKVTFSPIGRTGPFRKTVTIKTNGKHKNVILHIDGSVIPVQKAK